MSYDQLMEAYKNLQIEVENLKIENDSLKKIIFGSKREKMPTEEVQGEQCSIFKTEEEIEENLCEQRADKQEEITIYRRKKNKKRVAGIKKSSLKDVIFVEENFILDSKVKCPD